MSMLLDDRTTGPERSAGAEPRTDRGGARRPRRTRQAASSRASRSKAAQRALDRRERRLGGAVPGATVARRRIGGVPLVFPVIALIVGALGLTLYLTTKAAQDSYELETLKSQNQALTDKRDDLQRTFDKADAAPELAQQAKDLGMVPANGAVQLTVGPDGKTRTRGTATPADGKALPDLNPDADPVKKINPTKVDDSEGLGDQPRQAESTPTTVAPVPSGSPAPNVIPTSAATPKPDTARAR